MLKNSLSIFISLILISFTVTAQDTAPQKAISVESLFAKTDYNSQSEIAINEDALFDKIADTKSIAVRLPFLSEELTFFRKEYSIYGNDPSPWDEIKTYKIHCKSDPLLQGRIVTGPIGVNITYLYNGKMVKIYPKEENGQRKYIQELGISDQVQHSCGTHDVVNTSQATTPVFDDETRENLKMLGARRRVYRVGVSTTGEYYQANGNNNTAVRNQAITLLSDVSAMFEREVNIELIMAPGAPKLNNDPATDPYPNNPDASAAQAGIPTEFNINQYDLGHLFHTISSGGSGTAGVGVVCLESNRKAAGFSSFSTGNPAGFALLAAHEFGHQFGCPHTFNGDGSNCEGSQHPAGNAYEIGSGNTLMSYNGICGPEWNYPEPKNFILHATSLRNVFEHVTAFECNTDDWSEVVNTIPDANANPCGAVYRVPRNTAFSLTGSATDAEGDPLTYSWEQFDEDGAGRPTHGFLGNQAAGSSIAPILRNYAPTTNPTRDFPSRRIQANGLNSDKFERVSSVARTLHFRLVVRDNNPAGGATDWEEITMQVTSGSFDINSPNGGEIYAAGDQVDVMWSANGSQNLCANLAIRLSADGGVTFPYLLKDNVDIGSNLETVTIPAGFSATGAAKIQLICEDYDCFSFYDGSNNDFEITSECTTPNNTLCDTEFLSAEFRDPRLDLGATTATGNAILDISDEVAENVDDMDIAIFNNSRTGCTEIADDRDFRPIRITPTESGSYNFTVDDGGGNVGAYSIFRESAFNTANPCASFVSSNSRSTSNGFLSDTNWDVELDACESYLLCAMITESSRRRIRIPRITGPGLLLADFQANSASNITFVAVNELSDNIVMVNDDSDFTQLNPGTFRIHSIYYESGLNPQDWIGQSIDDLIRIGDCINVSANFKEVFIDASCAILNFTALDQTSCLSANNTYNQTFSFEVGMGPSTGMVTINGQTFPMTPGTTTVTLTNLISDGEDVNLNFSFSDDDGCVKVVESAFTAPANCCNIDIDLISQDICTGEIAVLDAGNDGLTYEWFFGSQPVFGNDAVVNPTEDGIYTVIVTDIGGCQKSETTTVSFNDPPSATINDDPIEMCSGDRVRLDVDTSNRDSLSWLLNGTPIPGLTNVEDPIIEQSGLYEIQVFRGGCMRSTTIRALFLDGPDVELGQDILVCEGESVILGPLPDPDLEYRWFKRFNAAFTLSTTNTLDVTRDGCWDVNGNGIQDSNEDTNNDGLFDSNDCEGQYIVFATNTQGCTSSDTVRVDIEVPFEIDLGPDFEECENISRDLRFNARNNPVKWFLDGVLQTDLVTNEILNPVSGLWEAQICLSPTCIISDEVVITRVESPDIELGPNLAFCEGEVIDVDLVAGPNSVYDYRWFLTQGTNPPEFLTGGIRGSWNAVDTGFYLVQATTRDNAACIAFDEVTIEYVSNPTISFPDATVEFCDGETETVTAMASAEGINWYFEGNLLSNVSGSSIDVSQAGMYEARIAEGQACQAEASFQVVLTPSPELDLPPAAVGCQGSEVELIGSTSTDNTYAWLLNGNVINGATTGTFVAREAGQYILFAQSMSTSCTRRDTTFVTFTDAPTINIADETVEGCAGESIRLIANSNVGGSAIVWLLDGLPITQLGAAIEVTEPGTYEAIVGLGQSCESRDAIVVTFLDTPIPNLEDDFSHCDGQDRFLAAPTGMNFTYVWSLNGQAISGENSDMINVQTYGEGLYEVRVQNSAGCSGTDVVNVNFVESTVLEFLTSPIDICVGSAMTNTTIEVTATGPTDNLVWYKDNNLIMDAVGTTIEADGSGTYRVVSFEGEACESSAEVVVTFLDPPTIMDLGSDQVGCEGDIITLDAGENPDYTYAWSLDNMDQGSSAQIEATRPGTYIVVVRDLAGCENSDTINVSFESQTMVDLPEMINLCPGADLVAMSNVSTLTWFLDGIELDGVTGTEIAVTSPGTYRAVAGIGTTCESEDQVIVAFSESPQIDIPDTESACQGDAILLTGGDDGRFTYTWAELSDGEIKTGEEGSLEIEQSGTYILTATNIDGCSTSDTTVIEFLESPIVTLPMDAEFCAGTSGTITVDATNVSVVKWYLDGNEIMGETDTTLEVTESGDYRVVAGEGLQCSDEATITVSFLDAPDISLSDSESACEPNTVPLMAGPDDAFDYVWVLEGTGEIQSGSVGSFEARQSGTYIVTATNSAGCETTDSTVVQILEAPVVTLDATYEFCEGEVGTLITDAVNVTVVKWYFEGDEILGETDAVLTVTEPGTYRVVAGEGLQCSSEATTIVTFIEAPDIALPELETACEPDAVSLTAGPDGDFDYVWIQEGVGEIQAGMIGSYTAIASGRYFVSATNSAGCTTADTVSVEILEAPVVTLEPNLEFCNGEMAILTADAINVTAVKWYFNGEEIIDETDTTLEITASGEYRVIAGEGLLCSSESTTNVTFVDAPDVSIPDDQEACEGELVPIVGMGSGQFDYTWVNANGDVLGMGSDDIDPLEVTTTDTYTLTAVNSAGCETVISTRVDFLDTPTVTLPEATLDFCDNDDTAIVGTASTGSVIWLLNGNELMGETDPTIVATQSGTYEIIAGFGTQCEARAEVAVEIFEAPIIDLDDQSICQGQTDILEAGQDGLFTYEWSVNGGAIDNPSGSLEVNETLVGLMGTVEVTATDDNNCSTTVTANVEFVEAPMVSLPETLEFCEGTTEVLALQSSVTVVNWYFNGTPIMGENGVTLDITEPGTYEAIAAEGQQCEASASIEVIAVSAPVLELGPDVEECAGTPVDLVLTTDTNADVVWDRGGDILAGESGNMITVIDPGVYTATVINMAGCTSSVSQEVQFFAEAMARIDNLPAGVCAGISVPLEATSDGVRFEWLDSNGNPIQGATGLTQEFSQSGDYSFVAYNAIDCATVFDFSLEFREAPQIDLGPSVVEACVDETIELSTPSEVDVLYQWTRNGSPINGENESSLTVTESGTYELTAINDIQCESSASVEVTFIDFPTLSVIPTESFCEGDNVVLAATTNASLIIWMLDGTVVASDVDTYTANQAGTYTVTATTPQDCSVSEQIVVSEIVIPSISFNDLDLCPNDPDVTVTVPAVFDTYVWSGGSATSNDENYVVSYQDVSTVTTETVTFVGMTTEGCEVTQSFNVTFQPRVMAVASNETLEICLGDSVPLEVTPGFNYEWEDPSGTLSTTISASPVATPIETTTYTVLVTGTCPDDVVVIEITVIVNDLPVVNAGEDREVLPDAEFTLEATGGVSYNWDNTDVILEGASSSTPTIAITEATTFTVTVVDNNGCIGTDDITININMDPGSVVRTITMFTPNQDGINDELEFEGLEQFERINLTVFSRWGNVVYEKRGYQRDADRWDGTRNGDPLPADTYYYILEFDGFEIKSSLTLLRD